MMIPLWQVFAVMALSLAIGCAFGFAIGVSYAINEVIKSEKDEDYE